MRLTDRQLGDLAGLDHLVLTVRDIPATCAFYARVLGMEPRTFGDGRWALHFGSQKINLHAVGREHELRAARATAGSGDLCFLTEAPVAEWAERLAALGIPLEAGPVRRTGACGPIESIYLRDPDGNLLEVARPVAPDGADGTDDTIAPLRAWLEAWQTAVRAQDFAAGRALCAPELHAFGTRAAQADGLDAVEARQWRHIWPVIAGFTIDVASARGAISGDRAWVAAPWTSRGTRPDGTLFARPGRLTIAFEQRASAWLAVHTHFSLSPEETTSCTSAS